ncbi:Poly(A)+ RNA export protein [Collybia nuda]|uniref:Poly(A)+ RNA export protein n=1 Tax=Collybia nuda TaxID=64659 RepID=A0A9P6CQ11_9AGAR|nr:Poly(A)+ RNA export protein [Collybia nuda]
MASFFNSSVNNTGNTTTASEKDIEMGDPPTDSISSMSFSPQADYLAVGSWDNSVRIYEVGANGQSQGKAIYEHQGPVMDVCWNKEGNKVFSGGADNAGRMFDVSTGQATQVAQHDAPIKVVRWVDTPQAGILATGSWDKTIKYWDLRAQAPVATVNLPERCYTFDVQYPLMVVGTAERHIQIFSLTNPNTAYKTITSPLKWQTRVVSCFPAGTPNSGFAVGSIEGRVAIQYVEDKDSGNNFSFKCHRRDSAPVAKDQAVIFPVNDISFHPVHGTFSTCGADGVVYFWDKDARQRLKTFDAAPGPISTSCFNHNGNIFAYAVSYDWSKGYTGMTPGHPNKMMLHMCKDDEVRKRNKK